MENKALPDEKYHVLSTQRKILHTRLKFRRFFVKEARHSENVLAKLYRSTPPRLSRDGRGRRTAEGLGASLLYVLLVPRDFVFFFFVSAHGLLRQWSRIVVVAAAAAAAAAKTAAVIAAAAAAYAAAAAAAAAYAAAAYAGAARGGRTLPRRCQPC